MPSLVHQLAAACASGLLVGAAPTVHGQIPGSPRLAGSAGMQMPTARRPPPASLQKNAAPAATDPASYRYVPTAALRRQTVQAVARQLQARRPAEAEAVRRHFGPGQADYDQLYTALLRESGLTDDEAASALALYLEAGYRIVNDVFDDDVVTPDMEKGLRQQAAGLLAHQSGPRTPAAVARLGEQLKLQCVLLTLGWQAAREGSQLPGFRAAVAQRFQQEYGFDMRELRITSQGLVEK